MHNVCAVHRGCAVHPGMFSTLRDVSEYTRGCSVQWGDTMSSQGDTMMSVGEYHKYTGGCSVHWGFHTNSIVFPMTFYMISPGVLMISCQCTEYPAPSVVVISPRCTEHPAVYCTDIMQCDIDVERYRRSPHFLETITYVM